MSNKQAEITYYFIIGLGYVWAVVQLCASEPFDAMVLFLVTFSYMTYRNAIRERIKQL